LEDIELSSLVLRTATAHVESISDRVPSARDLPNGRRRTYNVHVKKYSVSQVRERLSDALDQADRGASVLIERRGVTYRLSVDRRRASRRSRSPQIEILDKAVEAGEWSWDWQDGQLRFRARRR
jgi:hypothetical protein